jgi:UDP-N-acetylmuramate dehydrogenase
MTVSEPWHSLKMHNTLGLAQTCHTLLEAHSTEQLIQLSQQAFDGAKPMLVLGGGSNLLFTDDFDGVVIKVLSKGIAVTEDEDYFYLTLQAGEDWHGLVEYCLANDMPGLENLALIPGTVGAAPIQNIGAYGVEFCQIANWVEYLDLKTGKIKRLTSQECEFAYRESIFKQQLKNQTVITALQIRLPKQWLPVVNYGPLQHLNVETVTPKAIFDRVCEVRREKLPDPAITGNVGSFFKNPLVSAGQYLSLLKEYSDIVGYAQDDGQIKLAAGWLIDQTGLKGLQVGQACVHQAQALVLINLGGASGKDICELAKLVIAKVQQKFGVILAPEPRIMGLNGEIDLNTSEVGE